MGPWPCAFILTCRPQLGRCNRTVRHLRALHGDREQHLSPPPYPLTCEKGVPRGHPSTFNQYSLSQHLQLSCSLRALYSSARKSEMQPFPSDRQFPHINNAASTSAPRPLPPVGVSEAELATGLRPCSTGKCRALELVCENWVPAGRCEGRLDSVSLKPTDKKGKI